MDAHHCKLLLLGEKITDLKIQLVTLENLWKQNLSSIQSEQTRLKNWNWNWAESPKAAHQSFSLKSNTVTFTGLFVGGFLSEELGLFNGEKYGTLFETYCSEETWIHLTCMKGRINYHNLEDMSEENNVHSKKKLSITPRHTYHHITNHCWLLYLGLKYFMVEALTLGQSLFCLICPNGLKQQLFVPPPH